MHLLRIIEATIRVSFWLHLLLFLSEDTSKDVHLFLSTPPPPTHTHEMEPNTVFRSLLFFSFCTETSSSPFTAVHPPLHGWSAVHEPAPSGGRVDGPWSAAANGPACTRPFRVSPGIRWIPLVGQALHDPQETEGQT